MTFAVLLVCTGNLCRSVAAETVLRSAGLPPDVEVMSCGTRATEGLPVHPATARALAERGFAVPSTLSRRLDPDAVAAADLVLTATRRHRVAVVEADPTAAPRTFTVLEAARLMSTRRAEASSRRDAVRAAASARGSAPVTSADDLRDPVNDDYGAHLALVDLLVPAMGVIGEVLRCPDLPDAAAGHPARRAAPRRGH